jgi:hypothetical protein
LKYKDGVLNNIESFAKRTSIRNLGPDSKRLSVDELGALYDRFYGILYERQQRSQILQEETDRLAKASRSKAAEVVNGLPENQIIEKGRVGLGPSPSLMDYDGFREFLAGMTKWAISDSPMSPSKEDQSDREKHSYFGGSMRRRQTLSPWGGGPEPADHEFMRRLFRRWDVDMNNALTLQNVVTGLAQIKGKGDIMGSITYFFELYDDDGDGKVDREGILRISEALLFLSRRGLEGSLAPPATPMTAASEHNPNEEFDPSQTTTNERFLSSISAFIRRCFEYADPDHPQNKGESQDASKDGDDTGDLLDLDSTKDEAEKAPRGKKPTGLDSVPPANTELDTEEEHRKVSRAQSEAANAALDPSKPLHITLPTFRMVVLADELLEQFFESSFPLSFRILETSTPVVSPSPLTTFSNLSFSRSPVSAVMGGAGGTGSVGLLPPGKGLRGVLDNIVTDGMRVAAEVRRRMDEAQKEMEKNAVHRPEEDEEDEDGYDPRSAGGYDAEHRSVRSEDRDLLEGADAEAGSIRPADGKTLPVTPVSPATGNLDADAKKDKSVGAPAQKVVEVEFER